MKTIKTIYLVIENGNVVIHQAFENYYDAEDYMKDMMLIKDHEDFNIQSLVLQESSLSPFLNKM